MGSTPRLNSEQLQGIWNEWGEHIRKLQAGGSTAGDLCTVLSAGGINLTKTQMYRLLSEAPGSADGLPIPPPVSELEESVGIDPNDDRDYLTTDPEMRELLQRKVATYRRHARKTKIRVHKIRRERPFAICHLGDPHLDDNGCAVPDLLDTLLTIRTTDGMFGGNVGDTVNNWVGRLVEQYKRQETTEDEAFYLGKWFAHAAPWDYWLDGNHDHWNQGSLLFQFITADATIRVHEPYEVQIDYVSNNGTIRLTARHDFPGHSMWNDAHGPLKRAILRPESDILVCGHKHISACAWRPCALRDVPVYLLRLRGFKDGDSFAQSKGFQESKLGAHLTTVINPQASHVGERIHVFHDVNEAAWYLGQLRKRYQ